MDVNIVVVGNVKEDYLNYGIAEFEKRLQRFCELQIIEVKDENLGGNLSKKDLQKIRKKEEERILEKIPERSYVFALDVKGKPMTSEGFARSLQNLQLRGYSSFAFVIGGATGLSSSLLEKADYRLSLSHMTFTHQMIRLIILEQIYRAFKINNNEPYHL
ncbi:MAG: 23S rRNA (pseudouridine(1915)-N(3))-methyltransferase RlmH [Bacillota bacterium]